MKKKLSAILLSAIMIFGCGACSLNQPETPPDEGTGGGSNGEELAEEENTYVSLLGDRSFKRGFMMRGLGGAVYGDPIETFGHPTDPGVRFDYEKDMALSPKWNVCQWSTRYPWHDKENTLTEVKNGVETFNYKFTDLGNNRYLYENQSKDLEVDTNTGEIRMALRASECYKEDRVFGQTWPHFLLEQAPFTSATDIPPEMSVKEMDSLVVTIDLKLNSFVDHMGERANPDIHGAVCMFYLFVSYKRDGSSAFTDMIWFGLTIFDNRFSFAPGMSGPDEGTKESATGKWIYNVPATNYFSLTNNLYDMQGNMVYDRWASVNLEVYPYLEQALKDAQRGGKMQGATLNELYITGMYMGYEVTGTYDIDMSFKNMDIKSNIQV